MSMWEFTCSTPNGCWACYVDVSVLILRVISFWLFARLTDFSSNIPLSHLAHCDLPLASMFSQAVGTSISDAIDMQEVSDTAAANVDASSAKAN